MAVEITIYMPYMGSTMSAKAINTILPFQWIAAPILIFGVIQMVKAEESTERTSDYVQGVIVEGGVICPLLRSDDGMQIALQGIGKDLHPAGARLLLKGHFVRISKCMQGAKTLQVEQVLKVELPK